MVRPLRATLPLASLDRGQLLIKFEQRVRQKFDLFITASLLREAIFT
jgi:hypothetical protein